MELSKLTDAILPVGESPEQGRTECDQNWISSRERKPENRVEGVFLFQIAPPFCTYIPAWVSLASATDRVGPRAFVFLQVVNLCISEGLKLRRLWVACESW